MTKNSHDTSFMSLMIRFPEVPTRSKEGLGNGSRTVRNLSWWKDSYRRRGGDAWPDWGERPNWGRNENEKKVNKALMKVAAQGDVRLSISKVTSTHSGSRPPELVTYLDSALPFNLGFSHTMIEDGTKLTRHNNPSGHIDVWPTEDSL
ncbi:hypothetical protein FA13DRAFT_1787136 [Coprinellus micaceus]|uniref:Uncharacterized protein n=1 Tax=Coprinellus micaceus TaxID=71717 RepID=A0A4Y7TRH0_COPMI|nr:hypothetical protein FA13DRAFT_1787136 [Coprinellus micaceus]